MTIKQLFTNEEMNMIKLTVGALQDEDCSAIAEWIKENDTYYVHYNGVVLAEHLTDEQAYWLQDELNWD